MHKIILDIEVFPNYCLIVMKNIKNNKYMIIDTKDKFTNNQISSINNIIEKSKIIGFNIVGYDALIIRGILAGFTTKGLYNLSKTIINNGDIYEFNLSSKNFVIIDVFKILNSGASLKAYGIRINHEKLQTLPYDPHTPLSDEQIEVIKSYCHNDVDITHKLYDMCADNITIREELVERFGNSVLYKSDAQLAEMILSKECKFTKTYPFPEVWKYKAPKYIKFTNENYNNHKEIMTSTIINFNHTSGQNEIPSNIRKTVTGKTNSYEFGTGGLHSKEKNVTFYTDSNYVIIDKDVTSFYPTIMINNGISPHKFEEDFLRVFNKMIKNRIEYKASGDKSKSDILKIVINGTYGKMGNKYSNLYSPDQMLNVTMTGQLTLLMLIEAIESLGIHIISCNTDGVTSLVPRDKIDEFEAVCQKWCSATKYNLEGTIYEKIFIINVNNYFAISNDGKIKRKGVFSEASLSKTPAGQIIYDSVIQNILDGTPIEDYIRNNDDINLFMFARQINGGGIWQDKPVGKVARWINSTKGTPITYVKNGNLVATSSDAYYIDNISDNMDWKTHVNYDYYIAKAKEILDENNS